MGQEKMPTSEGAEKSREWWYEDEEKSIAEMTEAEIKQELEKNDIPTPAKWFYYDDEAKRRFLQEVREGKITKEEIGNPESRGWWTEEK